MMNIFEMIKNIFKKQKTLQLPEGSQHLNTNRIAFKKSIINNYKSNFSPLEADISAYLDSYYSLLSNYTQFKIYPSSYSALTRINSQYGYTSDKNYYNESNLLQNLQETNSYTIQTQSFKGETCFYHIRSKGYKLPNDDKIIRLYLNCKNDNVAKLADTILKYNDVPNFYLKFSSSNVTAANPRSEKIVIYIDENSCEHIINNLNSLRKWNPKLFQGSEYTCAFLPKINDFITYAREPVSTTYYDLYNNPRQISKSANSFLANALEESFINSVNEITCSCEPELYNYLNNFSQNPNDPNFKLRYIEQIPYIKENYYNYLIDSMTSKLQILAGKNNMQLRDLQPIYPQYGQTQNLEQKIYN